MSPTALPCFKLLCSIRALRCCPPGADAHTPQAVRPAQAPAPPLPSASRAATPPAAALLCRPAPAPVPAPTSIIHIHRQSTLSAFQSLSCVRLSVHKAMLPCAGASTALTLALPAAMPLCRPAPAHAPAPTLLYHMHSQSTLPAPCVCAPSIPLCALCSHCQGLFMCFQFNLSIAIKPMLLCKAQQHSLLAAVKRTKLASSHKMMTVEVRMQALTRPGETNQEQATPHLERICLDNNTRAEVVPVLASTRPAGSTAGQVVCGQQRLRRKKHPHPLKSASAHSGKECPAQLHCAHSSCHNMPLTFRLRASRRMKRLQSAHHPTLL